MEPLIIAVGFYAGLNLVAWVMIFCFVRETKQLTLEELDRKPLVRSFVLRKRTVPNVAHRGVFGADEDVYPLRIDRVASVVHQAIRLYEEGASPSAAD